MNMEALLILVFSSVEHKKNDSEDVLHCSSTEERIERKMEQNEVSSLATQVVFFVCVCVWLTSFKLLFLELFLLYHFNSFLKNKKNYLT